MQIISKSIKDTLDIGRVIAKNLKKGDIICLFGQLGSGKTILTKGIALGLGVKPREIISPSFVLIRQYPKAKLPFYHFDLYRLNSLKEILNLGYEEYFYGNAVTVIEWADRLKNLIPKECLKVELSIIGYIKRKVEFSAYGKRYRELISKIGNTYFRKHHEDIRH